MDNSSDDKGNNTTTEAVSSPVVNEPLDSTRRRFTRNALGGSAVVFSLGNRAAWGGTATIDQCLSAPTWESWAPGGAGRASFDPNTADPSNPMDAAKLEKLSKADDIADAGIADTFPYGDQLYCPVVPEGTPDGDSLYEGNVGRKGKRSVNANEYRNSLLDGGALDDGPLNGGPRR